MSETMTSGEIEDILSSIRRLVSEDLRPAPRPGQTTLVSDDTPRASGKLILTPALRVVPVEPPASRSAAPLILNTLAAASEVPALSDIGGTAPEALAAQSPEAAVPERASAADAWADEPAALDLQSWAGEADTDAAATPDPAIAGTPDAEPVPPGPAAREPMRFPGWPPVEGAEDWPEEEGAAASVPDADPAPRAEDVVGSIGAALHRHGTWEAETGDPAPVTRLSWIEVADDAAEDDDTTPPPRFVHRAEVSPRDPVEEPALIGTTEDVLDEAVLRDIVRAVLREELQGHLGERITRNIRKLVRAEINRSLTLRDYE